MIIYFVGISGIGISALAGYYLEKGHKVYGSCDKLSETAISLKKKGAIIFETHKKSNLPKDIDFAVYTVAVKKDNPEIEEIKKRKIKLFSYAEALGNITKNHYTIGISGTHGKSTTTAMISLILLKAKLDPTIIIGTKMKELGNNNYRIGKTKYLIIESDEYNKSFLNHSPDIALINNIEKDHLDCYKNLNDIVNTFKKYTSRIKKGGFLILNSDDKNVLKLDKNKENYSIVKFSLKDKDADKLKKILKVVGDYNIYNAMGALKIARILKIEDSISFDALSKFKGTWRRFEEKRGKSFNIISDYAHHPTALKVTLEAGFKKYEDKKVWAIFQPHQIHRTFLMFNDFVNVLKKINLEKVIITDIYSVPGREKKALFKKVNSEKIVKKVNKKNVIYIKKENLLDYIRENKNKINYLFVIGAGDIYDLEEKFREI